MILKRPSFRQIMRIGLEIEIQKSSMFKWCGFETKFFLVPLIKAYLQND